MGEHHVGLTIHADNIATDRYFGAASAFKTELHFPEDSSSQELAASDQPRLHSSLHTKSGNDLSEAFAASPELGEVVEAWAALSASERAAVLQIVRREQPGSESRP